MGPNEKILRDAYARYGTGSFEAVLDLFAENVVWRSAGASNRLSFAGERHGIAGIRDYFAAQRQDWTLLEHTLLDVITENDRRFVARVHVEARHNNTGARVRVEKVDFITMKDGKFTSYEERMDTAPIERAARAR